MRDEIKSFSYEKLIPKIELLRAKGNSNSQIELFLGLDTGSI